MNEHILIVEDDRSIQRFIRLSMDETYTVTPAKDLKNGIELFDENTVDLVILDLGLPDGDGLELIEHIRKKADTPIIVLSARGKDYDKVTALDMGADDYVTKPFNMRELMARIRVALRRKNKAENTDPIIKIKSLTLDKDKHEVYKGDTQIKLTPIEFNLLWFLAKNAGKVMLHSKIVKEVWGPQYRDTQSLRVYMTSLRRKIEDDPSNPQFIVTEVGVGYKMMDE